MYIYAGFSFTFDTPKAVCYRKMTPFTYTVYWFSLNLSDTLLFCPPSGVLFSPCNDGTTGITVETLHCKRRRAPLMEEVKNRHLTNEDLPDGARNQFRLGRV